ncbi:MAG: hypothetical protein LBM98_01680 [Oscillospiraceae bacterium]|nr:hypothetical protein [Oscillospiraceae bacterium]
MQVQFTSANSEGGFETRPYVPYANLRPTPRPHPLCGGVPPAGGGVVSPRRARHLIFDI